MKIVVISDTHGDFYSLNKVAMKENDADVFLHAGDVGGFSLDEISPFVAVKGNCDFRDSPYREDYFLMTPYGKLYMRHYPILAKNEIDSLREKGVKIFIHGHTHIKEKKEIEGLFIFCPGSLSRPRDSSNGSYLILEIEEKSVKSQFKTV